MPRHILWIAALCFLPITASAQNENITVTGKDTLTGIWLISIPKNSSSMELNDTFCRIQQTGDDLSTRCLAWIPKGTGEIAGKRIHLSWTGMAGFRRGWLTIPLPLWGGAVLDGTMESASAFTGSMHVQVNGISFGEGAAKKRPASVGRKFLLSSDVPDKAGKAKLLTLLLTEVSQGGLVQPHDEKLAVNIGNASSSNAVGEIRALGGIEAIMYLGEGLRPRPQPEGSPAMPPFLFSAYQVEFEKGQRLCGIHQREDGVVDGFLCV